MRTILIIITGCFFIYSTAIADLRSTRNGTVTDLKTGLIWQQSEGGEMSWAEAISYCENISVAGYHDWRLPSSTELQTLFAYKNRYPVGYMKVFPGAAAASYWSSTPYALHNAIAWAVDFRNGEAIFNLKSSRLFVRAVRGGY